MPDTIRSLLSHVMGDANGHMTIHQCLKIAKDAKVKSQKDISFDLVGPTGRIACVWLDPFLEFFKEVGKDTFLRVVDIGMCHDIHVENVQIVGMEADGYFAAASDDDAEADDA